MFRNDKLRSIYSIVDVKLAFERSEGAQRVEQVLATFTTKKKREAKEQAR